MYKNILLNIITSNFIDINTKQAFMVLNWRNDKRIRKNMFNSDIISVEDHFKFIKSLYTDKTKAYFLVMYKNMYVGVIDFYDIEIRPYSSIIESAWWGYYLNPALLNKGYGFVLEELVIAKAFRQMNMNTLKCETLKKNDRVWKLHEKYGFMPFTENTLSESVIMMMDKKTFLKNMENDYNEIKRTRKNY